MVKSIFYIFFVLLILSGCSSDLPKQAYVDWVQDLDNGLIVRKEIGNFAFELFYKPLDYQILQAGENVTAIDSYKDTQHYTLKIESLSGVDVLKNGAIDDAEYNNRLFYLADYIQNDLRLIENGDTLPCLFSHYERNYGLAPYAKVTFAFQAHANSSYSAKTIQYDDPVFGAGRLHFHYSKSVLENIPNLKK